MNKSAVLNIDILNKENLLSGYSKSKISGNNGKEFKDYISDFYADIQSKKTGISKPQLSIKEPAVTASGKITIDEKLAGAEEQDLEQEQVIILTILALLHIKNNNFSNIDASGNTWLDNEAGNQEITDDQSGSDNLKVYGNTFDNNNENPVVQFDSNLNDILKIIINDNKQTGKVSDIFKILRKISNTGYLDKANIEDNPFLLENTEVLKKLDQFIQDQTGTSDYFKKIILKSKITSSDNPDQGKTSINEIISRSINDYVFAEEEAIGSQKLSGSSANDGNDSKTVENLQNDFKKFCEDFKEIISRYSSDEDYNVKFKESVSIENMKIPSDGSHNIQFKDPAFINTANNIQGSQDIESVKVLTGHKDIGGDTGINLSQGLHTRISDENPVTVVNNLTEAISDNKEVVDQISAVVEKFRNIKTDNVESMQIKLKPDYLGSIKINLINKNNSLDIHIETEHLHTKEILNSNIISLKQDLNDKGISTKEISVNLDMNYGGDEYKKGYFKNSGTLENNNMFRNFKEHEEEGESSYVKSSDVNLAGKYHSGGSGDKYLLDIVV